MDGVDLKTLVRVGELRFALKAFLISMHWLWLYDYFLTLGDEIMYAWSGMKSWVFVLFVANRYTPILYLTWVNIYMFDYTDSVGPYLQHRCYIPLTGLPVVVGFTLFSWCISVPTLVPLDSCQKTRWISAFHMAAVTVLAQTTVALRVYAVTRRNKLLGGSLLVFISVEFCFGIYFIVRTAMNPLVQSTLPDVEVDAFEICVYRWWKLGELLFANLVIGFDLLALLIILVTTRRMGLVRYPGIPTLLDIILRQATLHFIFIAACQLVFVFFLIFAPEEVQPMPGVVNVIFVPVMASRLMLSLKEAAVEPTRPWSLETMTGCSTSTPSQVGTIRFAPRTFEVSESPVPQNEDVDSELETEPRFRWNRG